MALEAIVFSKDPLTSFNSCNKEYSLYDYDNYFSTLLLEDSQNPFLINNNIGIFDDFNQETFIDNVNQSDQQQQEHNNVTYDKSSPEEYFLGEAQQVPAVGPAITTFDRGAQKKRRRRSGKNKEEVEQQRMTHIAVERNRRKQMNEYLATIRSLMPPSYVQRGDQASIVGGAINYVKELEQQLHSMEAQNRSKAHQSDQEQHQQEENQNMSSPIIGGGIDDNNLVASSSSEITTPLVFSEFFSFPQYSTQSNSLTSNSGAGEIEVTMVESHANVKILAKKQPKQLLKLIAGFQGLRINVLHLNVTTLGDSVLYSLSLKVEEGCQLNSVDDMAAAANHILVQIQEEAIGLH